MLWSLEPMAATDLRELPDESIAEIVSVFDGAPPRRAETPLEARVFFRACKLVADASRIEIAKLPPLPGDMDDIELLDSLASRSNFRYRRVALTGDWWRWDHGPLLVFRAADHEACALVPDRRGRYRLADPARTGTVGGPPVTAGTAAQLDDYGYCLYRALPDQPLNWKDLLGFGLQGLRDDVKRLLFVLAASSLLGLLLPVSLGVIFDHVIPNANVDLLIQFIMALAVIYVSLTLFYAARLLAGSRLELRMNVTLQAAVWDRLLRLPMPFFRRYAAGDLADRASGIDEIQETITGNLITSLLAGPFSVASVALMFYYDFRLALGTLLLTLLYAAVNVAATLRQLPHQREMQRVEGMNQGYLLQVLAAIDKLRVADRTEAAFGRWLSRFARSTQLFMRAEMVRIRLLVFSTVYAVLLTGFLFAMVAVLGRDLSLGSFMAFSALYGGFFSSMIALSAVVASSLEIVPIYERAKPILQARPEKTSSGLQVAELEGDIRIDRVSFRYPGAGTGGYAPEANNLFADLNIRVSPGELLALTGPSGCGKSTLFRLLLGFERPLSGSIYYDHNNLLDLDVRALRGRIGVVLQHSTLMPGTILENIFYGGQYLSEEEAWNAARVACIDREIESLPMGMHTYLSEGGENFSVGQRQRILLARAFAKAPKILFLDEATSALDNDTQSGIMEHIRGLGITCIAAAHRLSTVESASRILVLDKGQIVQEGSFAELSSRPGLFSRMAGRQSL
jgi:NHLM bacteriocin system ABC transporter ATP-binding protein